ncbi:MAG TPA: hypothetical protein VLI54_04435 [Bacillota bacterium]|nr:hypothetical protein [Bacillota bacterium]
MRASNSEPPLPITFDASYEALPKQLIDTFSGMTGVIADQYGQYTGMQTPHITKSHEAIIATADEARSRAPADEPRRAIVLGAGNCIDIPINHLVQGFDHVTLVDADPHSTQRALAGLPKAALGKISLIGADITGTLGPVAAEFYRLGRRHNNPQSFARAATNFLGSLSTEDRTPDLGAGFAFVSSQLLMSQLGFTAAAVAEKVMRKKYRYELSRVADSAGKELTIMIKALSHLLNVRHIEHLRGLVADSGTVHFADTYSLSAIDATGVRRDGDIFSRDMILPEIATRFDQLRDPHGWAWPDSPEREYRVMSLSMTPRVENERPA